MGSNLSLRLVVYTVLMEIVMTACRSKIIEMVVCQASITDAFGLMGSTKVESSPRVRAAASGKSGVLHQHICFSARRVWSHVTDRQPPATLCPQPPLPALEGSLHEEACTTTLQLKDFATERFLLARTSHIPSKTRFGDDRKNCTVSQKLRIR